MTTRRNALWLIAGDNAIRRAMTWAVIFAASWALLEISLGAELRSPFNLLQIVWCRYATHLGICLLLWGWRRPTALWKTSRPILHVSRSLMMVIMPAAFMLAIHLGIAAEFVWSVFWIAPALIIALARLFLEENPPPVVVVASVAGYLAAVATIGHRWPPSSTALGLALIVAGSFSIYVVMTRSLRDEAVEANMFYTAVCPFVALTPFMPSIWLGPDGHEAIVLMAIGLTGFVSLLALDHACRSAPLWSSANALFAQAFCVAGLVYGLLGVRPALHVLVGMAALLATIGFLWVRANRFAAAAHSGPSRA